MSRTSHDFVNGLRRIGKQPEWRHLGEDARCRLPIDQADSKGTTQRRPGRRGSLRPANKQMVPGPQGRRRPL